jgi:hypothetical protein
MLSKSLSTSERRARLHDVLGPACPECGGSLAEFAQALYPLLVAHADDFGREAGDLFTVKHAVDPSTPRTTHDLRRALQALADVQLIRWYVVEGRNVIEIVAFEEHQTGLHKRTRSKFPEDPGTSEKFPPNRTELKGTEQKGTEQKGTERKRTEQNRTQRKERGAAARTPAQNVRVIAQLVVSELLPINDKPLDEEDLVEETKQRCARLQIAYDGRAVKSAVSSALAQARRA